MPLELILLRHAEAFSDAAGGDHARALTMAGKAAATRVGATLAAKGLTSFAAITSDARRAKETAAAVGAATGVTAWAEHKSLYLSGIDAIAEVLKDLDGASVRRVVIVGHNPGWSEAVHVLAGERISLGTAAAAWLKCDADEWPTAISMVGSWDLVSVL
jgi:phosphohistidine phosphatase